MNKQELKFLRSKPFNSIFLGFNEGFGTTAHDRITGKTASEDDGSIAWGADRYGSYLDTDTGRNLLKVDQPFTPTSSAGFSVVALVRPSGFVSADSRLYFHGNGANDNQYDVRLDFNYGNTSAGRLRIRANIGGTQTAEITSTTVDADDTVLVAGTYDGSTLKAWFRKVDGTEDSTTTSVSGTVTETASYDTFIGGDPVGGSEYQGIVYWLFTVPFPLSVVQLRRLAANDDLFNPLRRRRFTFASSGGATVSPSGISPAEAFGSASVSPGGVSISPSSISSGEAFGSASITTLATIQADGISSAEAFGSPVVTVGSVAITPLGISSAETFGSSVVASDAVLILPSAISSAEAFGSQQIDPGGVVLLPDGIGTAEAFGSAVLFSGAVVLPASIETLEAFGSPSLSPGEAFILPSGISSGESFGVAQVGDVVIAGNSGIVSSIVGSITKSIIN